MELIITTTESEDSSKLEKGEFGCHSTNYATLFGGGFQARDSGKPWRKGIARITYSEAGPKRSILRRFVGFTQEGFTAEHMALRLRDFSELTNSRLPIKVTVTPANDPISRFLFSYNHPDHAYRIPFRAAILLAGFSTVVSVGLFLLSWCISCPFR